MTTFDVRHPRIKPIYPAYRLSGTMFRIGAQLGITAEFDDPDAQLWTLVQCLDGRPTDEVVTAVLSRHPSLSQSDVLEGIDLLDREGFVEEAMEPEVHAPLPVRYLPNVNYFSRFSGLRHDRYAPQRKLNESRILLLGLGGGGSNILTLLSGLGPKEIRIVDHDQVEESNLGRQFLYRESNIGQSKVEAAAQALRDMNSDINVIPVEKRIDSVEDVERLSEGADLVIAAIDEPPFVAQRIVNKAIVRMGIPCVFGASQVTRGRVYSVVPGTTGCFDCLNVHYTQRYPQFVSQFSAFRDVHFDPPSIAYGPAIFMLTAAIVDEAVRVLTNYQAPRSLGTQFEIDYENASAFTHPSWPRLQAECPTCGDGDTNDWEIFSHYTQQV